MTSGRRPKIYDPEMVAKVASLYADGLTQEEIARALLVTQKVIWKLMLRHEIKVRVAAKRAQSGSANHAWKGDSAKYAALHLRVQSLRGTPSLCEHCGSTTAKRFEWANLTGKYEDVADYVRLCVSCHHKMDGHVRNLGAHAKRKEVLP